MGIIYAKQSTSALLPFHIRLGPLKLPRDPLKGLAGSPRDLLKILIGALTMLFQFLNTVLKEIKSHCGVMTNV